MANVPSPTAGGNPLLVLAREQAFRNEHTAATLVRKLWQVPHSEEWQHLTSQLEERREEVERRAERLGLRPIRLLQAEAVMAAVVTTRGRERPATVRIHGTSWTWGELPEQARLAFDWTEAVAEARRVLRGDVAQREDDRLVSTAGGIEIGDAVDALKDSPIDNDDDEEPPVHRITRDGSQEQSYLVVRLEAKEKGVPKRKRNAYACQKLGIALSTGRNIWMRVKRKAAKDGWPIEEL